MSSIVDSPTSPPVASAAHVAAGDGIEMLAPTHAFDPNQFMVSVPRWRRILDHIGITGSAVKPRWRLNAELATFVVEHPRMTVEQKDLVIYAQAVEASDVDSAWTALNAAKRIALSDTKDDDERIMRGRALRVEAQQKLTGWRQATAMAALGDPETETVPTAKTLVQVQELIDAHNDNRYRQMGIHARSLRYIGSLVVLLLIAFGVVVGFDWVDLPSQGEASVLSDLGSYIGVVVLGAMGALLSVFMSRIAGPDANPLKDLASRVSGYVRPLLGGLSAVVVVLVLESDVQSVITLGDQGIYVGALLAGFSERLIDRALGGIAS